MRQLSDSSPLIREILFMSDRRPTYKPGAVKTSSTSNLRDFAEYIEGQAKGMEQFGWKEVHGLRQWVSELRKKVYHDKALSD